MVVSRPPYAAGEGRPIPARSREFAATISSSNPEMVMAFTSQVVPNSSAVRLTNCDSMSMKPAPRKKNGQEIPAIGTAVFFITCQHTTISTEEIRMTQLLERADSHDGATNPDSQCRGLRCE